ncbi:hypothetical protein RR48_03919 [Papilio machaon]|uniref:Uncharacterized protein n=1 Tax=Papilio machaon TaxID=76193 RepID=A0A0N1IPC2_PAPMA|nr:hypothetical protein RR48_03919 [Papilio machaon]
MGSHNSHEKSSVEGGSGSSTPRGSQRGTRSGSSGELPEKPETSQTTSMVPVEKLAKLLVQRSQKEDGVNGVTESCFAKYLFPMYPDLARHFFKYLHKTGKCKNKHINLSTFKQQCERIMALLDDNAIIEAYVRMFSSDSDESVVTPDGLRSLLYISYKLSMDHYPEGPQTCLMMFGHSSLCLPRMGEENKEKSLYCVHMLATRHRDIEAHVESNGSGAGLELATPVLERGAWHAGSGALLPVSAAWLLAATAPPLYSRPAKPPPAQHSGGGSAAALWLARLVCAVPSHWAPLYASREHGLGANRFLHHTLAYRSNYPQLIG